MKTNLTSVLIQLAALLLLLSILNAPLSTVFAQGTTFSYQGHLNDGPGPANGTYDLTFRLWDDPVGGNRWGPAITNYDLIMSNGLFAVTLDFGNGIFTGGPRWMEIGVRTNGVVQFTALAPRQPVLPVPYAIFAGSAATANTISGVVPGNGLFGLYSSPVYFNNPANSFTGDGNGLTNVDAKSLGGIDSNGFWRIAGNGGTTAGAQFLGTTDDQPLELKVNGLRVARLEPGGDSLHDPDTVPDGAPNVIFGAPFNFVPAGVVAATISGGGATNYAGFTPSNSIAADFGTIGGGGFNGIGADSFNSTIGGGYFNHIGTNCGISFIGGGYCNNLGGNATANTIAGGESNYIATNAGTSTIGGGYLNSVAAYASYGTIGGGTQNTNRSVYGFIGGGQFNSTTNYYATVAGGMFNQSGDVATVGGGQHNTSSGYSSTVGGGEQNQSTSLYTMVGGGFYNASRGSYAMVGGGEQNAASGIGATVGGGIRNIASADKATISGGQFNISSATNATIGGGGFNTSSGIHATVGGGIGNISSSDYATIPGGCSNYAAGRYSFAAGRQAVATNNGSFVWADSQPATFPSTADDQFSVRARGGVQLNTDTSLFFGNQTRQMLNLYASAYGIGVQPYTFYFRDDGGADFVWYQGGSHTNTHNDPGAGGAVLMRLASNGELFTAGAVNPPSDRNLKQNFAGIDPSEVLAKVVALPVQTWEYKSDGATRHLGPVAQDFYAAFGVGPDDKHIATVDADGVALAAIQGLNQKVEQQAAQLKQRDTRIAVLEERLSRLETLINKTIQPKD